MNYIQYLQKGAELAQPEVEKRLGKEEVNELVKLIIVNQDEESARILVENAIKDPENGWIADWISGAKEAAENGNENAIKFWQIVGPLLEQAQQAESFKCGGKVRAKVKKAYSGKKMQEGSKIVAKKDCPCKAWKKVGGKLVEVNCEDIPKGLRGMELLSTGIKSFIAPFQKASELYTDAKNIENDLKQKTVDSILNFNPNKVTSVLTNHPKLFRIIAPTPGMFLTTGLMDKYLKSRQPEQLIEPKNEQKSQQESKQSSDNLMLSRGFTKNEVGNWVKDGVEYDPNGKPITPTVSSATQAWRNNFGTGKSGRFGGLTYDEALARQNEMASAGFTNFGASDGMWGNKSKAEWERYQKWKEDQEVAKLKAENSDLSKILPSIKGLTTEGVTITGGGEPSKKAMLFTPSVHVKTAVGQTYIPSVYKEDGTGDKYSFVPLSRKNGGVLSYYNYINR